MVFGGDGAAVRGGRNPGDGGRVGCTAGKRASKCATRSILRYVDFAAIRKHGRLSVRQVRFDRRATHGAHRLVRRCPRPSRAAPPPPRQAWPAPRPRYGPARTLAGPCARGARERSSGRASFPRRNCFVTHACGRVAFSRRAVFSVSARGQFSYCVRPRSPLLIRCTRRTSTPAPRVRHTYPSAASLASTACPNARAHSADRDVGGARGVYLSRPGLLGGRGAASLGAQLLRASADEPLGGHGSSSLGSCRPLARTRPASR